MNRGSSLIEILIALAVLTLGISASVMVVFGNQSLEVDNDTNSEALYQAKVLLERARASSTDDFLSINNTNIATSSIYVGRLSVTDLTPCRKEAISIVSWNVSPVRSQKIELTTNFSDITGSLAVGGDCFSSSPDSNWDNPTVFASDTLTLGKPTATDVLNKLVYLGSDHTPFLHIASTTYAVLGQTNDLFVTFVNGFSLVDQPNALDAVHYISSGKTYVYAAMNTSTKQLNVIDVTDIFNPVLVASSTLANTSGSFPEGWIIAYFDNRLYVINRETAGAEFHIFNVSNPINPIELGSGTALNITVEDIAIQEKKIGGVRKRFAYLATDQNSAELKVYDITDPSNTGTISEIVVARQDLPGNQDGASVYVIGNKLYFGRQSAGEADLYIYNTNDPTLGLLTIGSADIGTGVLDIIVAGKLGFLATPKAGQKTQIWNISNFPITHIVSYNFGNIADQGIDYEADFLYVTGQTTPNFRILYSP